MIPRPAEARVTLEDDSHGLEYVVRFVYTMQDPDDEVRLERVEVLEVRQRSDDGRVVASDTSTSVRRHDERVWELLEDDPATLERVEEECRRAATRRPDAARSSTGRWMQHVRLNSTSEQRGAG